MYCKFCKTVLINGLQLLLDCSFLCFETHLGLFIRSIHPCKTLSFCVCCGNISLLLISFLPSFLSSCFEQLKNLEALERRHHFPTCPFYESSTPNKAALAALIPIFFFIFPAKQVCQFSVDFFVPYQRPLNGTFSWIHAKNW